LAFEATAQLDIFYACALYKFVMCWVLCIVLLLSAAFTVWSTGHDLCILVQISLCRISHRWTYSVKAM